VPPDAIPAAVEHLRGAASPELADFLRKCAPDRRDLLCAIVAGDPSAFLNGLLGKRALTKRDLEALATTAGVVPFPHELLQVTVLRAFAIRPTKRKLQRVLAVVANVLAVVKKFTETFVESIVQFFRASTLELSAVQVARCFLLFVSAVPQHHYTRTYLPFLKSLHPISPEAVLVYLSLAWVNPEDVFHSDVPGLLCKLFASPSPSLFCLGLRLFERALACLPERRLAWLFRHGFEDLAGAFVRFRMVYPVAESSAPAWLAIVSNPALKPFAGLVLQNALVIIPDPPTAAFAAIANCLPPIIEAAASEGGDVSRQLLGKAAGCMTAPPSLAMAKFFVRIVGVRADFNTTKEKQLAFVLIWMRDWVENRLARADCFALADLVFEVCALVLRVGGIGELMPFIAAEMFRRAPRFFPVFVGIARFLRAKVWKRHADHRARIAEAIRETGRTMACRAHGEALRLMLEPGMARRALDLARFDCDCEESDRLRAEIDQGAS
jgi:hypothetical protein